MELVSIIMPVYNGEKYIIKSIESVIAQTYTNWELIIVDDYSKDKSMEIIEKFQLINEKIKVTFLKKNVGSSGARNKAISNAKGRYLAFLDSDDIWEENFLEEQLKFMLKKKAELVYSSYKIIDENDVEILKPYIVSGWINYKELLKYDPIGMLTAVYDIKSVGKEYFDTSLGSIRDDYVYWLKILKKLDKAYGNNKILAKYRVHKNSITSNKYKMIIPQFNVYRKIEKLSLLASFYYMLHWGINGMKKYYLRRTIGVNK